MVVGMSFTLPATLSASKGSMEPTGWECGWVSEPLWAPWKSGKYLTLQGIEAWFPYRRADSLSHLNDWALPIPLVGQLTGLWLRVNNNWIQSFIIVRVRTTQPVTGAHYTYKSKTTTATKQAVIVTWCQFIINVAVSSSQLHPAGLCSDNAVELWQEDAQFRSRPVSALSWGWVRL
jgi:hypothetical protein